ncbi:MAG: RNA polymerase-associated protein RapA [Spongiibacteraceae bacterium]
MNFVVGQRWLSHADPQLGLGIITAVEIRRISVLFPAVGEERTYSLDNAPLSRIAFRIGDSIGVRDELELTVTAVDEVRGLLMYTGIDADGNEHRVAELQLNALVQLHSPQQRLSSGQCDSNTLFALRVETLEHLQRLQQSNSTGLIGARTNLLPHQVYIAQRVAQRFAPRVLLADEVGLGKTIEAGMIAHQQLLSGRAQRVLLLLPTNLQHQWLVEMLRRFNLRFSLFDAERYAASLESGDSNPFESEQLVLCAIDWLAHAPEALQHALAANWDLTIVDEAHHLHCDFADEGTQQSSIEYRCVEQLAARSAGLILLTATPEQAGIESHFARLRLLDPARFHDLAQFKAETARYPALNAIVQQLLTNPDAAAQLAPQLRDFLNTDKNGSEIDFSQCSSSELIQQLLDRHGTGRVLFRNTRAAVQGFPERRLHVHALPSPEIYNELHDQLYPETQITETRAAEAQWLKHDPRVQWLEQLLKALRPEKVLVICANAHTAIALEQHLHLRAGIRSAAFHEGLTLIERDRAAAWFAETDLGAQTLVCSEIGSEGRNFQFAQHLVLFDLPSNPDLLEQRIGRLDRIGQGAYIDIHVPYLQDTAQHVLFRWYHEGLDAFQRTCAVGFALYEKYEQALLAQLQAIDAEQLEQLLQATARDAEALHTALEEGRDALLELNSCNKTEAQRMIDAVIANENSETLHGYLERIWDNFGVDHETHSEHAVVVRPSEQMLVSHFPELSEEGFTATCERALALSRDDMEFLSWEHPHTRGAMEMIVGGEYGNAAIASITVKGLPPGTLLLEAVYSPHCPAPRALQVERFLPATPLRFIVDRNGKNLSAVLPHAKLNALCSNVPRTAAPAIIARVRTDIAVMQEHAAKLASVELPQLLNSACAAMTQALTAESERLQALQAVNPAIRNDEIEFFRTQLKDGLQAMAQATLQLQALRLIVTT